MTTLEYKAVPAPLYGVKAKDAKSTEDRYALAVTQALNDMAAEGWQYLRAETLPCEERKGLTGKQTTFQNVLIFARVVNVDAASMPMAEAAPLPEEPVEDAVREAPIVLTDRADDGAAPPLGGATRAD